MLPASSNTSNVPAKFLRNTGQCQPLQPCNAPWKKQRSLFRAVLLDIFTWPCYVDVQTKGLAGCDVGKNKKDCPDLDKGFLLQGSVDQPMVKVCKVEEIKNKMTRDGVATVTFLSTPLLPVEYLPSALIACNHQLLN